MAEAARVWRRSNEEADCLLGSMDRAGWTQVRYEELCALPEETLLKIRRFLGLAPRQPRTDFRSFEHHVVGNGMRFDTTSEIRLDERWRTQLTPRQLRVFDRVAGDLNRTYGYE